MSRPSKRLRLRQALKRFTKWRTRAPIGKRFVTKTQARADRRVIMRAFSSGQVDRHAVQEALGSDHYGDLLVLLGFYRFPLYQLPRHVIKKQRAFLKEVFDAAGVPDGSMHKGNLNGSH